MTSTKLHLLDTTDKDAEDIANKHLADMATLLTKITDAQGNVSKIFEFLRSSLVTDPVWQEFHHSAKQKGIPLWDSLVTYKQVILPPSPPPAPAPSPAPVAIAPTDMDKLLSTMVALLQQNSKPLDLDKLANALNGAQAKLPEFTTGMNIDRHMKDFTTAANRKNMPLIQRIDELQLSFKDNLSRDKFDNLATSYTNFTGKTWTEIRELVLEEYSMVKPALHWSDQYMKHSMSPTKKTKNALDQYKTTLDKISSKYLQYHKSTFTESQRVNRYCWGLHPSIKEEVISKGPTTMTDAVELSTNQWIYFLRKNNKQPKDKKETEPKKPDKDKGKKKFKPLTQEERKKIKDSDGCFYCRLLDHTTPTCPSLAKKLAKEAEFRPQSGNDSG